MASLQNFPEISSFDTSICEKYGQLCSLPITEVYISGFNPKLAEIDDYPDINVGWEAFHAPSTRSMDVIVNESSIKRVARIFAEDGLAPAIQEAANLSDDGRSPAYRVIKTLAQTILRTTGLLKRVKFLLWPQFNHMEILTIAQFSEIRDWNKSPIRFIKWHPNTFKLAVASNDDCIRIYTNETCPVPILKSGLQKNISSLAWRPFSASELAVGCQSGILMWNIDPNSQMQRPLSQAQLLKFPNNDPVSSIEWSPNGCLLAAASFTNPDIIIWDIDQDKNIPLRRVGFPSSIIRWSLDGYRLFSGTTGNIFRVWNTEKWTPERWTLSTGIIQSAAWSTCGSYLLFVTTTDPYLYSLCFIKEQLFAASSVPKEALPIAELAKRTFKLSLSPQTRHTTDGGNPRNPTIEVGGRPQAVSWCPQNQNLAISFKDTSAIAIFNTNITNNKLSIAPSCFLIGIGVEFPSFITFQSKYRNKTKSVLTIGWSNGRIQYFPFL